MSYFITYSNSFLFEGILLAYKDGKCIANDLIISNTSRQQATESAITKAVEIFNLTKRLT